MSTRPLARSEGLAVAELDGELLVYDLERNKAHRLNGPAGVVWRHCDGQRSVADLAAFVGADDPATGSEVVWLALKQLDERHLLAGPLELPDGVSRREALRKLALAGAVGLALPVIKSIVAPTAAQAATCIAPGMPCAIPSVCCSGVCNAGFCL